MANHADITEGNLHENKGASTASDGQFLVADGLGNSVFETRITKYTATLSPSLVAANTTAEETFTLTGVLVASDFVMSIHKPTHQAGLGITGARISANDTIAIQFMNNTGSGITPTTSELYTILVYQE